MCFYQCFSQILICWSFFSEFYTHNWHNNYSNCNRLFHLQTCDLLRPWNTCIRMDPASIIQRKRQRIDTSSACFFCQNNAGDLRTASAEGKARTRAVGEQRRQLGDTSYVYVLDRLNILSDEDFDGLELRWHKTCYSNFSSESKLQRLRKQCQTSTSIASTSCPCISSTSKRRSCQAAIDWSLCMFCQAHNNKKVHRVETLEKSADLLE